MEGYCQTLCVGGSVVTRAIRTGERVWSAQERRQQRYSRPRHRSIAGSDTEATTLSSNKTVVLLQHGRRETGGVICLNKCFSRRRKLANQGLNR